LYCGIDVQARSMDVCVLRQEGAIRLHRTMQAAPEPLLKAVAPYRAGLGVAVAGLFPWYWLADLCPSSRNFHLRIALMSPWRKGERSAELDAVQADNGVDVGS
jgi:hypothetical protein